MDPGIGSELNSPSFLTDLKYCQEIKGFGLQKPFLGFK